jgi:hypothetical protein
MGGKEDILELKKIFIELKKNTKKILINSTNQLHIYKWKF